MNPATPIQTSRLDLEPVRPEHANEAWPHLNDERMWRYFEEQRPPTEQALRERYERWTRGSQSESEVWLNWLCRERSSAQLAGGVQATVHSEERYAYVAYAIYPPYRRLGYAREATLAVIEFVRRAYAVDRFVAEMDKRNEESFRLAESLGFTRAGTHANDYVYELRR